MTREEALTALESPRGWNDRLAFLGALFSWRTMTAEQAAAFVGSRPLANALSAAPAALFNAGVLDLGVFSNGLYETRLAGRGAVYRTGSGDAFDQQIKHRLSWAEWVSITGGQPWAASSKYDRHNVLGTELGLRFAEYADVGTVLGERFCSCDQLTSNTASAGFGGKAAADLAVVRPDGLRIAVEITANTGTYFKRKVEKWARVLAENSLDLSGLCVVFVVVEHPERLGTGSSLRAETYRAIDGATKEFPGSRLDRVAERIGVTTWREWFPGKGLVHDAFRRMRVDRPTGRGADLWEPADMLSATDRPFEPTDPEALRAVLNNSALLGQTPKWLRSAHEPPDMERYRIQYRDQDGNVRQVERVPVPTPARPESTKGRALGEAVGAAGPAQTPRRLLGLEREPS